MKTLKLLGIIALSALIIFIAFSCDLGILGDGEEGDPYLKGNLSIKVSDYGPYSGKELEAIYTGTEDVTYEWFRNGSSLKYLGATNAKYTPSDTNEYADDGESYQVYVRAEGIEDPKTASVKIYKAPAWIAYFGTWLMNAQVSANSAWLNNSDHGGNYNETVVITNTSYKITSTRKSDATGKASATGTTEMFDFTITSWAPAASTVSIPSGYSGAFTLTGTTNTNNTHAYDTTTTFTVYMATSSNGQSHKTNRSSIDRTYVRQ